MRGNDVERSVPELVEEIDLSKSIDIYVLIIITFTIIQEDGKHFFNYTKDCSAEFINQRAELCKST